MSSADANELDQIVNALKHSVTFFLHRYSEGVADQLQFVRERIEGATRRGVEHLCVFETFRSDRGWSNRCRFDRRPSDGGVDTDAVSSLY